MPEIPTLASVAAGSHGVPVREMHHGFDSPDPGSEAAILEKGARLLALMDQQSGPALFSRKGTYARLMEWTMRDPAFKTQLFRFVDVLPSLRTPREIVDHLREYLGDRAVELHPALKAGLGASSLAPSLVAGPVKAAIIDMAGQFVAGSSGADLVKRIRQNEKAGIATTVDLLGEAVVSDAEADAFLARNLEVIESVSQYFHKEPRPCFSDIGPAGPLPRLNLSLKISCLAPRPDPADPEGSIAALKQRIRPLLRRAAEAGALVNFDMEHHDLKDLTLELFRSVFEEEEFRKGPAKGIALQAYLRDCEKDLRSLIAWARRVGTRINIRLVKGAYWDFETVIARQRGWPEPVWTRKEESDANFEKLSVILLENTDVVTPDFGTHNVRSCAHVIATAERMGRDPRSYEFQGLYGMADDLKAALVSCGHRVREYCAIGEMLPGMAYLVRRLLENTSNEGFVRKRDSGAEEVSELLANPVGKLLSSVGETNAQGIVAADFRNAPNTDFGMRSARDAQTAAIARLRSAPCAEWMPVIDGKESRGSERIISPNPAHPAEAVARWSPATLADADRAVEAARRAFPLWRDTPVAQRAAVLERAAQRMEELRFDLNALIILEAGKPWAEADADVSEAVDFCRYYAREMTGLDRPEPTQSVPGEDCVRVWTPRGVGVALAPWNFPLAILTGLVVAPLVAGNAVLMKPAEQTTAVGGMLMRILREAGAPAGVLQFLPGRGEEIGARLVAHPQVDFIAFTGSRDVGISIWEQAGRTAPGQINLKKVVCEMGGKNALIIDNDADLDEAVPAALHSAFAFAGQKCSALSRLIVLDGVYHRFVERFLAACGSWRIGDPSHPATMTGPVIDEEARRRILSVIEEEKRHSRLLWQGKVPPEGWYVPPTVFGDVTPGCGIDAAEIFGPVVGILRAKDLDEAFAWVNASPYALTGGLFSRSPGSLARARRELMVGNLYLNRSITGAIVGRHPFGGFRMSGGGTKAGGPGYLENFLFPRVVAENTLRRGFTPEEA